MKVSGKQQRVLFQGHSQNDEAFIKQQKYFVIVTLALH
jgi:hypothetical protein